MSEEVDLTGGLKANRTLRQQVIDTLLEDPNTFRDPKVTRVLLAALKDADASLIGEVRAKAEDKNADANAQIAAIASNMAQQFTGKDLLAREPIEGECTEKKPPTVEFEDLDISEDDISDGLLEPITEPETYDKFMQRFPEDER